MADSTHATMEATLLSFLNDHSTAVQEKSLDQILSRLTPDCTHLLAPSDFAAQFKFIKPVETNADFEARIQQEFKMLERIHIDVISSVIDPVAHKGSAHVKQTTTINNADFAMETCFYLEFSPDGNQISKVTKFPDTLIVSKMIEKMGME